MLYAGGEDEFRGGEKRSATAQETRGRELGELAAAATES